MYVSARRAVVQAAVVAAMLALGSVATAGPEGLSIAINFGADEPDGARSDVTGAAGVLGTTNWNNLDLLDGTDVSVNGDDGGSVVGGVATVTWVSNNTWSSTGRGNEENNTAPDGGDRNLMTGYLDTNADDPAIVTVSGLDGEYSVYVYMNGGVLGRGGDYAIEGHGDPIAVVDTEPFDGTYVEGENYVVFNGVTGASFTLTATPTTGGTRRAPINAIEVVVSSGAQAVPALSPWGLAVLVPLLLALGYVLLVRRQNLATEH